MKVLEFEAKALLREAGIALPRSKAIATAEDAHEITVTIGGPVVVKAQVPVSGRMKVGGVQFANTSDEAVTIAAELFRTTLRDYPVDYVLVEEKLDLAQEVYVAVTYDQAVRSAVILASTKGGIDIESRTDMLRFPFSLLAAQSSYLSRDVASALGFSGQVFVGLAAVIHRLVQCFIDWDALLLEVNPLILDREGRWWVADIHLELDDDAAWRQEYVLARVPRSREIAERRSEFEQQAIKIDSTDHRGVAGRLVPLGGNLGLLIGGGGASLTILDAVFDAGLEPANYCEIGGNPSVWKVKELTKLILNQPRVTRLAVIMNVVSNTRVDLVARGVIKGALELGLDPCTAIAVFRIPGSWESEGQAILDHYGVRYLGRESSLDQAIDAIRAG